MKRFWKIWVVVGLMAGPWANAQQPAAESRIVLARVPEGVHKFTIDPAPVRARFVQALCALTGQPTPAAAWRALGIEPTDVVGIKINAAGGPVMSTRRALVDAIAQTLGQAGVPPQRVIVWDKFGDALVQAGYSMRAAVPGIFAVQSVIPGSGFDPKNFYVHEVPGTLIWGDLEFVGKQPTADELLQAAKDAAQAAADESDPVAPPKKKTKPAATAHGRNQISNKSYFARLVTERCTKLVNVGVLMDHATLGVNGCLTSLALGSVDNTRRFSEAEAQHYAAVAVAEINAKDPLRKKTVLHVLDGLVAQCAGGPEFSPHYCQSLGMFYLSRDPVALDALAAQWIEKTRRALGVPAPEEKFDFAAVPQEAAALELGQADAAQLQIETVGAAD